MGRREKASQLRPQPLATAVSTPTPTGIRLRLRVQPRSAHDQIMGLHGDALRVRVTAPPVDGAANRAVVELLARWLDVPVGAIVFVRGQTGRDKVVEITADPAQVAGRLTGLLARVDKRRTGD